MCIRDSYRPHTQGGLQAFSRLFNRLIGGSHILVFESAQVVQRNQHDRDGLGIGGGGNQRPIQVGEKIRPVVQAAHRIAVAELTKLAVQTVSLAQPFCDRSE